MSQALLAVSYAIQLYVRSQDKRSGSCAGRHHIRTLFSEVWCGEMQRLWGLRSPQRTSSKQLSIGTPGSNILDTGLLHQLRVVCALRPSALLNLTKDGSLKDLQIQVLHHSISRNYVSLLRVVADHSIATKSDAPVALTGTCNHS